VPNGFEEYGDIFEQRGHRYHAAMCACPHARDAELEAAVAWSDLRAGQVLCDVPSGAGYLRRFVDARVTVVHVETSAVFARLGRAQAAPVALGTMYHLPLRTAGADRVLSLAALHHVADKRRFYREAFRILRPGGALCIGDAGAGSPVACFLNGFVHAHNSMGHEGRFIGPEIAADLEAAGFRIDRAADVAVPWRFRSPEEMVEFVQALFGLDRATPAQILQGVSDQLGWDRTDDGCQLRWALRFVRATRPSTAAGTAPGGRAS
jgi:SAM-dependent methyltransferase